ncbi:hypothetical protein DITRI_Ditri09bG0042900 [Diplodiscus trichospermus]
MEYQDVYDVKLKPRILEYLINDQIPIEIDHSPQHCDLQGVVNAIRNLGLLSESFPEEANNSRIAEDWAIAVDSWVDRVLSLVSSPRPASDYVSVKVATFSSLSNLLKRLGRYPDVKKDVTAQAGKLIQPLLELLVDNEFSEVVLEGALAVLCTIIDFFPASFLPHYEKAEAIIVSKIISGRCSSSMMKSYAYFLASLPKSRGEKDSWFVMMQDILASIEFHLNDVFQGLEEGIDPLVPETAPYLEARKSKRLLTCIVPTLMLCCSTMLTNSYPVQVTVPVQQLLSLVKRVLMLHGSFSQASLQSMAIMRKVFVCTELPVLQSYGLDLLAAIIKGTSRTNHQTPQRLLSKMCIACAEDKTLLNHKDFAFISGYWSVSFCKYLSPPVCISKVVSCAGAALHMAEELISNAVIDLDALQDGNRKEAFSLDLKLTTVEASMQPAHKKRKHAATNSPEQHLDRDCPEVQVPKKFPTSPISLKIATLKALETLLTMGAVLRCDLRPSVNNLLINVAVNAYNEKWTIDEESELMSPNGPSCTDFLLAALHALLASLLSQTSVCQHHLVKALELFRKGKQEAGTKVADFCALALLASEMLMNPRKVSAADTQSASHGCFNEGTKHEISENLYLVPNENETPNPTPAGMINSNQDEALFDYLLNSYNESEATLSIPDKNIAIAEEPSRMVSKEAVEDYQADHIQMLDVKFPGKEDERGVTFLVDVEMERNSDDILYNEQFPCSLPVADIKPFPDIKKVPESEIIKVVSYGSDFDFLKMAELGERTEDDELDGTPAHEKDERSFSGFIDESPVNIHPAKGS